MISENELVSWINMIKGGTDEAVHNLKCFLKNLCHQKHSIIEDNVKSSNVFKHIDSILESTLLIKKHEPFDDLIKTLMFFMVKMVEEQQQGAVFCLMRLFLFDYKRESTFAFPIESDVKRGTLENQESSNIWTKSSVSTYTQLLLQYFGSKKGYDLLLNSLFIAKSELIDDFCNFFEQTSDLVSDRVNYHCAGILKSFKNATLRHFRCSLLISPKPDLAIDEYTSSLGEKNAFETVQELLCLIKSMKITSVSGYIVSLFISKIINVLAYFPIDDVYMILNLLINENMYSFEQCLDDFPDRDDLIQMLLSKNLDYLKKINESIIQKPMSPSIATLMFNMIQFNQIRSNNLRSIIMKLIRSAKISHIENIIQIIPKDIFDELFFNEYIDLLDQGSLNYPQIIFLMRVLESNPHHFIFVNKEELGDKCLDCLESAHIIEFFQLFPYIILNNVSDLFHYCEINEKLYEFLENNYIERIDEYLDDIIANFSHESYYCSFLLRAYRFHNKNCNEIKLPQLIWYSYFSANKMSGNMVLRSEIIDEFESYRVTYPVSAQMQFHTLLSRGGFYSYGVEPDHIFEKANHIDTNISNISPINYSDLFNMFRGSDDDKTIVDVLHSVSEQEFNVLTSKKWINTMTDKKFPKFYQQDPFSKNAMDELFKNPNELIDYVLKLSKVVSVPLFPLLSLSKKLSPLIMALSRINSFLIHLNQSGDHWCQKLGGFLTSVALSNDSLINGKDIFDYNSIKGFDDPLDSIFSKFPLSIQKTIGMQVCKNMFKENRIFHEEYIINSIEISNEDPFEKFLNEYFKGINVLNKPTMVIFKVRSNLPIDHFPELFNLPFLDRKCQYIVKSYIILLSSIEYTVIPQDDGYYLIGNEKTQFLNEFPDNHRVSYICYEEEAPKYSSLSLWRSIRSDDYFDALDNRSNSFFRILHKYKPIKDNILVSKDTFEASIVLVTQFQYFELFKLLSTENEFSRFLFDFNTSYLNSISSLIDSQSIHNLVNAYGDMATLYQFCISERIHTNLSTRIISLLNVDTNSMFNYILYLNQHHPQCLNDISLTTIISNVLSSNNCFSSIIKSESIAKVIIPLASQEQLSDLYDFSPDYPSLILKFSKLDRLVLLAKEKKQILFLAKVILRVYPNVYYQELFDVLDKSESLELEIQWISILLSSSHPDIIRKVKNIFCRIFPSTYSDSKRLYDSFDLILECCLDQSLYLDAHALLQDYGLWIHRDKVSRIIGNHMYVKKLYMSANDFFDFYKYFMIYPPSLETLLYFTPTISVLASSEMYNVSKHVVGLSLLILFFQNCDTLNRIYNTESVINLLEICRRSVYSENESNMALKLIFSKIDDHNLTGIFRTLMEIPSLHPFLYVFLLDFINGPKMISDVRIISILACVCVHCQSCFIHENFFVAKIYLKLITSIVSKLDHRYSSYDVSEFDIMTIAKLISSKSKMLNISVSALDFLFINQIDSNMASSSIYAEYFTALNSISKISLSILEHCEIFVTPPYFYIIDTAPEEYISFACTIFRRLIANPRIKPSYESIETMTKNLGVLFSKCFLINLDFNIVKPVVLLMISILSDKCLAVYFKKTFTTRNGFFNVLIYQKGIEDLSLIQKLMSLVILNVDNWIDENIFITVLSLHDPDSPITQNLLFVLWLLFKQGSSSKNTNFKQSIIECLKNMADGCSNIQNKERYLYYINKV